MVRSGGVVRSRLTGLAGVVAAGALAAAGLGSAPPAQATCASFFGLGNTAECTSNLTSVAIAIGAGATAHADGLLGSAFAVGTQAGASTAGALTFATAMGDHSTAASGGIVGMATQLGPNGYAVTNGSGAMADNLGLNFALNITPRTTMSGASSVVAIGIGNVAVNLFDDGTIAGGHLTEASGTLNGAITFGGTNNRVGAGPGGGTLNFAFSVFGSGNLVLASPGPLAIAGSILQTGATVDKQRPGFNINGFRVGGAAAVGPSGAVARHPGMFTAGGSGAKTTAHARTGRHGKKSYS